MKECVSEQGRNGILWTVFEGAPFTSRRIASFGSADEAREYLTLTAELEAFRKAEKITSDAYLRIRALVDAWDTNYGGENRFEVTEQKIKNMKAELTELRKDKERLERIKPFIREWTLKIQKHRELTPTQLDHIFQTLYHWYCELDVEERTAIDAAMKEKNV